MNIRKVFYGSLIALAPLTSGCKHNATQLSEKTLNKISQRYSIINPNSTNKLLKFSKDSDQCIRIEQLRPDGVAEKFTKVNPATGEIYTGRYDINGNVGDTIERSLNGETKIVIGKKVYNNEGKYLYDLDIK